MENNTENKKSSKTNFEKELDELGTGVINIKINKGRFNNKDKNKEKEINKEKENKKNEEKENNNKELTNKNINKNNEDFNLDDFNNFLEHNKNIQVSNNNQKNQLKSHLKPHLKLNLGIKKPSAVPPQPIQKKQEDSDPSQKIINDEDIKDNININDINNINKLNNHSQNKIKNNNAETSFILKQKFDNINESQISYEGNASVQNSINNAEHKVKKKFKLSLYQLQKLALLGAGASGEVYLVQDTITKKKISFEIGKI